MKELTVLCPAKINLTLAVTGKTADGYHEIKSIMQTVSLYDEVTVSVGGSYINLQTDLPYIPRDRRNIAYKAAEAFFAAVGATYGVRISIKKHIPVSAGLAGGSADGAGVLYALNRLFGSPLDQKTLCGIATPIGADVPFCMEGGTRLATGIGEKLQRLPDMPRSYIIIAKPQGGLSAAEVYKAFDAAPPPPPADTAAAIRALEKKDVAALASCLGNALEPAAVGMLPQVAEVKEDLGAYLPLKALMSGSGSSVFAVFKDEEAAKKCLEGVRKKYRAAFLVRPTSVGVREKRPE
ncbi:MAG: 4-(cytidine 5'-diphospho)-2-C-methyl-D-erythritol kinase [Clostridia bacterium]|nr:4-(cytidine 5'-diphospho)-2-C-methyl-D-erythritol kinase [Clostridia bacterium]